MYNILINNPSAKVTGAVTILKETLEKISKLKCNRIFYVIVSLEELKKYESDKLKIIVVKPQNFRERIIWDNFELKNYLARKKIKVKMVISLQNTGVNLDKNIKQILYFHQGLSLAKYNWSLFYKEERILWFYQNIFPFFIKMYLKKIDKIIVQTNWVKNEFSKKFKIDKNKIVVMKPKIKDMDLSKIKEINKQEYIIFYPATYFIYKNHKIILEALGEMNSLKQLKNIKCIFTISKGQNREVDNLIKKYKLENIVELIGNVTRERVLEYYKNSDLMIFPSLIETFGLPLLEAQKFNLKIVTLSLPYTIEVLEEYSRVEYIHNHKDLIKILEKEIKNES